MTKEQMKAQLKIQLPWGARLHVICVQRIRAVDAITEYHYKLIAATLMGGRPMLTDITAQVAHLLECPVCVTEDTTPTLLSKDPILELTRSISMHLYGVYDGLEVQHIV